MIASHAHRFIFLKTRKTAGTSVEIALSSVCGPDDTVTPIHEDDEVLRAAQGVEPRNWQSPPLAVKVRNHSTARQARRAVGVEVWRSYFRFTVERNPWDQMVSLYFWTTRNSEEPVDFGDFVRERAAQMAESNAAVYRLGAQQRIAVDRVCRYERLDEELRDVWDHLGLPGSPDLPHAKGGVRPAAHGYREMYDAATRDVVATAFAASVRDLGYEF